MGFLGGVVWVHQLPVLPTLWWGLALLPAALLAYRQRTFLPLVFFIAGVFWTSLRAGLWLDDSLAPDLEGRDLQVEGVIADLPERDTRRVQFLFIINRAWEGETAVTVPRQVQLSLYDTDFFPRVGDVWRFTVRLKRPYSFQNPGGFDYEAYLFQHHIRALGYVREQEPRLQLPAPWFSYPIGRLRQSLSTQMHATLQENPFAPMLIALANGDQSAIQDSQWEILRRTGTLHLMAISGMHISLVAGLAFFIIRRVWAWPGYTVLWWPATRVAAVGAMLAGILYAALAGFAIPTQRALVMLAVVLGAIWLARPAAPSHLLACALLAVLVYDPVAVLAPGFWLSFLAVAGILYGLYGRRRTSLAWVQRGWTFVRLQGVVSLALLPVLLWWFQQASLSAPLANLLAIPVVELWVVPATLLGVVLFPLWPGAASLVWLAGAWGLEALWQVLSVFATLEPQGWWPQAPSVWGALAAGVGILLLLAPPGWPARWVGVVWLLPLFFTRPTAPAEGEVWFTLLDVGQGLATVARTREHVLVYDTGARFSARLDAGSTVLVPYLRNQGLRQVDTLVVSHADNDHLGGAESLRGALPVGKTFSSTPQRLAGAAHCQTGQAWQWNGVEFRFLHPPAATTWSGNNASCVLQVISAHGRILLPGDIEASAEQALVDTWGKELASTVLVAPHHGSKTSSSDNFLAVVDPRLVLFPAGYRSRYGHPHPRVLASYQGLGVRQMDSVNDGAISLRLAAGGMAVVSYRREEQRYWFTPNAQAD